MIGYPDKWRDYSAVEVEADDYYGNIQRATMAEYERILARQNDPVDRLKQLISERQDETMEILRSWMEDDREKT